MSPSAFYWPASGFNVIVTVISTRAGGFPEQVFKIFFLSSKI